MSVFYCDLQGTKEARLASVPMYQSFLVHPHSLQPPFSLILLCCVEGTVVSQKDARRRKSCTTVRRDLQE